MHIAKLFNVIRDTIQSIYHRMYGGFVKFQPNSTYGYESNWNFLCIISYNLRKFEESNKQNELEQQNGEKLENICLQFHRSSRTIFLTFIFLLFLSIDFLLICITWAKKYPKPFQLRSKNRCHHCYEIICCIYWRQRVFWVLAKHLFGTIKRDKFTKTLKISHLLSIFFAILLFPPLLWPKSPKNFDWRWHLPFFVWEFGWNLLKTHEFHNFTRWNDKVFQYR